MNLLRLWCWKIKWHGWLKLNKYNLIREIEEKLLNVSETPYLDAKFFVDACEKKGFLPDEEKIQDFLERRKKNEPVSKIVESRGFWALDFYVTHDVLDPRADSETLIEAVLDLMPDKQAPFDILDIGTGSGCLLVSLLYEYKNAKGTGIDISKKALAVAKKNAEGYQAHFFEKNFYDADFCDNLQSYDIIISNPPYIKTDDIPLLDETVRCFDPQWALDGGKDGLNAYRELALKIKPLLRSSGFVFFEIGQGQHLDVIKIMQENGFCFVRSYKDLGQIVRVLVFK